jgi:hypothetical protein
MLILPNALIYRLRQCKNKEVQLINSAAFSVAMSGREARLYLSEV